MIDFERFWTQAAITMLLGLVVAAFRNSERWEVVRAVDELFPIIIRDYAPVVEFPG